ncbi:hypothetical protein DICSQDRAFT_176017 [Dichomitus squalens LYAD-421 SS1]|uniref:Uncharacterized protein n=1 Tax=Dichomitus squalens (strain LYAD-421) TaxID=732165 RepID=R7SI10_DICSQ|nr:uncharacterized protein DICSQDRAFT_176017 [Dichomitus squalens LYAD-421 SS1]EJF55370.1 hypothetical protein DICSQDRAFT_176017 [Dichomitus squalens LYAD-421 SS1]
MPHIVSDVSIGDPGVDDGPDGLTKFCQFMLNKPEFAKALRALHLLDGVFARSASSGGRSGWGADFSPAGLVAKGLFTAVNLRVLHIRDAEPLFQSHPAVYEAITKLDRLKLQGKLQVIENGLWKDGPRPQGDVTPFRRYVESLRHIRLWECGYMLESVID